MALWGVRAGRHGERENYAIDNNCVVTGWNEVPDLGAIADRNALLDLLKHIYPSEGEGTVKNWETQLWAFAKRIQVGDLIALPRKLSSTIAFGRASGSYRFVPSAPPGAIHQIPVEWITIDLPRQRIDQDLLYSLGSAMTVFQVSRNDAETRIRQLIERKAATPAVTPKDMNELDVSEPAIDIERVAQDRIIERLGARFRGPLQQLTDRGKPIFPVAQDDSASAAHSQSYGANHRAQGSTRDPANTAARKQRHREPPSPPAP